jgi:hypothetical protein
LLPTVKLEYDSDMGNHVRNGLFVSFYSLLMVACGSSSQPAASPSSEPAAGTSERSEATDTTAASSSNPALGKPESGKQEGSATKHEASSSKPASRPPREVLELKDTVFFLAYGESDLGRAAEASCSRSSGKNPKAMAACVAKAREQADEGYRFEQDKEGDLWWLVVDRKGNTLVTLHRVRFTYGAETETTIVIKPEGKDYGSRPWRKAPSEVKFEVPNEYRIVVRDPERGRLVYEAKVGIATGK